MKPTAGRDLRGGGHSSDGICRLEGRRRWNLLGASFFCNVPLGQGSASGEVDLGLSGISANPCTVLEVAVASRDYIFASALLCPCLPSSCRCFQLVAVHGHGEQCPAGGWSSSPSESWHWACAEVQEGPPYSLPSASSVPADPSGSMPFLRQTHITMDGSLSLVRMSCSNACGRSHNPSESRVPNNDIGGSGVMTCFLGCLENPCHAACRTFALCILGALLGLLLRGLKGGRHSMPSRKGAASGGLSPALLHPLGRCAAAAASPLDWKPPRRNNSGMRCYRARLSCSARFWLWLFLLLQTPTLAWSAPKGLDLLFAEVEGSSSHLPVPDPLPTTDQRPSRAGRCWG